MLALASAYYSLAQRNWIGVLLIGLAAFGVGRLESLILRHLTRHLYVLIIGLAVILATIGPAWPKLLTGAIFVYFLSFAFAARVTFHMMMRNDRAYRAMYSALRFHFPNKP